EVADDDRRGGRPPLARKAAEVARPERFAVHAVAVQPALAEERHHPLAVGGAGRGGPSVLGVARLGRAVPGLLLPEDLPTPAVDAGDEPGPARVDRGRQEDPLAPDDRRRLPAPPEGSSPGNRLGVPLERKAPLGRVPVSGRPP